MWGQTTQLRLLRLGALGGVCLTMAACSAGSVTSGFPGWATPKATSVAARSDRLTLASLPVFTRNAPTSGEESFSSAAFGVSASPRVASGLSIQRGGGVEKIGRPYTVRGVTYRPTADQPRFQDGRASWYGEAFHGRKTANGEIYDMNHLTAAHKTMPLPSYARVTNKANGKSVVVRINDRGPFSNNRVIDLSKRAAYLLDYIKEGTAEVRVEYLGRAPLDGRDDNFLLASFDDGSGGQRGAISAPRVLMASNAQPAGDRFAQTRTGLKMPRPAPRPERGLGMGETTISAYADWRVEKAFEQPIPDFAGGDPGWKGR